MPQYVLSLVLALCVFAPRSAEAVVEWQSFLAVAQEKGLSHHPKWRKLLHFNESEQRSEIISEDFFLSSVGDRDPDAELVKTLQAYFLPFDTKPNEHARCRFPARYFWLNKQLNLPAYTPTEPRCRNLNDWSQLHELKSVSLLMVSGYFGNPASAFGHALLKFNRTTEKPASALLDVTFNFGAMVPPKELTAVYIYKGLTGGYLAGFSDSHYYSQDLVYSRTEFRDMWEYELELSTEALTLLVFHLWEIAGKKFTYYFLSKNCAYRLAEAMELATGDVYLTEASAWYAPVELFHRLHTLDAEKAKPVIRSVRFIPSTQRVLYQQFGELNPEEQKVANTAIEGLDGDLQTKLNPFDAERQIEIVDALLAYYEYRLADETPETALALREAKDNILRTRLRLPPRKSASPTIEPLDSPASGSAPMLLGVGVGWDSANSSYARFQWAPFHYDLLGLNNLENGELVTLDTAIGVDERGFFLDRMDLIRVRVLRPNGVSITGESNYSWHMRVGLERNYITGDEQLEAVAELGLGHAMAFGNTAVAYAGLDGLAHSSSSSLAIDPNAGIVVGTGRWKSWIRSGIRYDFSAGHWSGHGAVDFRYQLAQHQSLRLDVSHDGESRVLLMFNQYQ